MTRSPQSTYDAVVIGGGFYGAVIALYLVRERKLRRVLLLERETKILARASYLTKHAFITATTILAALRRRSAVASICPGSRKPGHLPSVRTFASSTRLRAIIRRSQLNNLNVFAKRSALP